jgi:hypothetical protein
LIKRDGQLNQIVVEVVHQPNTPKSNRPANTMLGNVRTRTLSNLTNARRIRSLARKSSIAALYNTQITAATTNTNKICFHSGHWDQGTDNKALIWPTDQVQIMHKVKDRRDTLLQELQKLIECVLHDGHSGWRELSQDTQLKLKLKDNTISERRFSDAFASALTQMRLS